MIAFEVAHKFTEKWEKGLVDHPNDPGGITKNGISIVFLKSYAQRNGDWLESIGVQLPITPNSIRNLTTKQETLIFERAFWLPLNPELLPDLTAVTLYDANVNCGLAQATRFLQRACNKFEGEDLVVDGGLGPKTRQRMMSIGCTNDRALAMWCISFRDDFYNALASDKPSMKVFLKGWLNRTADLQKYLGYINL